MTERAVFQRNLGRLPDHLYAPEFVFLKNCRYLSPFTKDQHVKKPCNRRVSGKSKDH